MKRLSKTFQLALCLTTVVSVALTTVHNCARADARGVARPSDLCTALSVTRVDLVREEHSLSSPQPLLPFQDGEGYAEVGEREFSESEGDEDHSPRSVVGMPDAAVALQRACRRGAFAVEQQSPSPQAAVPTGAPRGPPASY